MAARSVTCTLFNESASHDLTLVEATLEHGIWSRQGEPPGVVPRGSEGVWESESNGFMTGTEGRAVYAVGDSAVLVAFHWNNPFIGENSFSQRVVPPESGSPSGLHLEDVVAFDPVRDAPRGPRYLHDRPADPVHDDNVAIGFRFEVRGAKREAEHPVLAQGLPRPEEVRATTAPPGRRTTSRDATAFPQVVYCGLNMAREFLRFERSLLHSRRRTPRSTLLPTRERSGVSCCRVITVSHGRMRGRTSFGDRTP